MTSYTNLIHISQNGTTTPLQRVPMGRSADGQYSEAWLQQLLFEHPKSLPIREIDPHAGALIPVCMELQTSAGPADILYVTRTGQIVLVETKLWRNPEARRTVVAQILDYAKELSSWSYEDLSREAAQATGHGPGHLLDAVRAVHANLDEAAFVDGINRSLAVGDFILVIAGDGIQSGAQALVSFLERYGHLRFQLALVEIASYRGLDDSLLLQPRVLAKTELLVRSVLLAQPSAAAGGVDDADEDAAEITANAAKNAAQAEQWERFWAEYLAVLRLDDMQQPPPARPAKTTNIYLYLPPGSGCVWITAFVAQSQGRAGVFLSFSKIFLEAHDWYERLYEEREEIERVVPGLTWERQPGGKIIIMAPPIACRKIDDPAERLQLIAYLALQTNAMVNAFRFRLEAFVRERANG
ncbi:DUF4268 domain-containing protein [Massilia oculi]|uniref:DUF4268 domain-containing protein n=1 Tax=Massilia oculi TaxID=945844 RepID=A0A2S2DIP7_9BURK|nr:DUF4268 domain-containing protein [Massilia oculi]AWL05211.1 DUF4268 domain-containing protein [Massilia oculi]